MIERYESFGFTKEDYDEMVELKLSKVLLWDVPEKAKGFGMKPAEFVTKLEFALLGRLFGGRMS